MSEKDIFHRHDLHPTQCQQPKLKEKKDVRFYLLENMRRQTAVDRRGDWVVTYTQSEREQETERESQKVIAHPHVWWQHLRHSRRGGRATQPSGPKTWGVVVVCVSVHSTDVMMMSAGIWNGWALHNRRRAAANTVSCEEEDKKKEQSNRQRRP